MFNTRKECNDILNQLEKETFSKFKKSWKIIPWAIIKLRIGFYLHHIYCKKINISNKEESVNSILDGKIRKKDFWKSFKLACYLLPACFKLKGRLKSHTLLIAFTGHIEEGYNKLLEPYQEILTENKEKNLVLYLDEMRTTDNELNAFFYKLNIFIVNILKFSNLANRKQIQNNRYNVNLINEFFIKYTTLDSTYIASIASKAVIDNHFYYVYFYVILKILLPRKIWFSVYYTNHHLMALTRAARQLNIDTCEYQHSVVSDNHFAYMKWNYVDDYYDSFPKTFQVWSDADRELILRNFSGEVYRPEAIVTGNYYLNKQQKKYKSEDNKGNVLICLQGMWIPPLVEEAIAESKFIKWYFRLHPRYSQDRPQLLKLHEKYPYKIEIEKANSLPLYELFSEVTVLIASYSTVALEGKAFGLKVIIVGEEGYSSYENYIKDGHFYYATNKSDLLNIIGKQTEE